MSGDDVPSELSDRPDVIVEEPWDRQSSPHEILPTDVQIQRLLPRLAKSIARMDVTDSEVLRTCAAYQAFQHCAAALRIGSDGDFYHKSRKSAKISTFWSHSWHGGHRTKILTLITFYNGAAAVSLGLLTAVLMMLLFIFKQLPGFHRGLVWGGVEVSWSTWSLCSGVLVTCLVAMFWQPQTQVFFDRICISQVDAALKAQAIFSLAGLLKSSDQMLILWDPTWTQRLWCLFELAAFLQSRKTQKQALTVRPVFLGPVSICVFLTMSTLAMPGTMTPLQGQNIFIPIGSVLLLGMIAAFPAVSTVRSYFRDLDVMKQQLLSISFDATKSACCDQNHVDPRTGQSLLCDRKIVKECVNIWFGNQQVFEDAVRSEVLKILERDLSERVFSSAWCLGVTSPVMLIFLDLAASMASGRLSQEDRNLWRNPSAAWILDGLVFWLLAFPAAKDLLICFCRLLRRKAKNFWLEALKNTLTVLLIVCPLTLLLLGYLLAIFFFFPMYGGMLKTAVFAACALILSVSYCFLAAILKALLQRPGWWNKNRPSPYATSSILMGFSLINYPFGGTPILGNIRTSKELNSMNSGSWFNCVLSKMGRRRPSAPIHFHYLHRLLWCPSYFRVSWVSQIMCSFTLN